MSQPAIFLDRDGTLIEDVGVLSDPSQIRLFADTLPTLRLLGQRYLLFVVTNQNGIAKGQVSRAQVDRVNAALDDLLSRGGVTIQDWYVCPHDRRDECQCIKPNPTFLLQAADQYDINLSRSFVIGDHPHDPATGDSVGAFGLYVLTGHGLRHLDQLPAERLVFHTLAQAGQWILAHPDPAADIRQSVEQAAQALRDGKLAVFPTETVYGLGADVFNARAAARIFEVKQRPLHDPFIVHISSVEQIERLARSIPPAARLLMERCWPGPLTLVLPKADSVPDIVTAGNPTLAVRMPSHPLAEAMIRLAETPVAAPSANLFGRTSPTTAEHVREQLGGGFDALIDGGSCRIGIESTVLSLAGDVPTILRHGGVTKEQIESLIGSAVDTAAYVGGTASSPGMLTSHYAPRTPLTITDDIQPFVGRTDIGKLLFEPLDDTVQGPFEVLTSDGDLRQAAVNLYYAMRRLDGLGLSRIVAQPAPDEGLGKAINDRLQKAAAGHGASR